MEEKFKKLSSDDKWDTHYALLNARSNLDHPALEAAKYPNTKFNRYMNIIPFDRSRVKLQRLKKTDYINANLVTVPKAVRQYILTQGPLPETLSHFWLMVWEQKSSVIVMLNKIIELDYVKCEQYWPKEKGDTDDYDDVQLSVTLKKVQNFKHYTMREMLLTDNESEKTRTILQFQYTAWPDHGQPESPTSLLRLITAVRRAGGLYKMDEPTIVHCSAGVGRSGTFCLIDAVLSMVENQGLTEGIDIDSTLLEMREYRAGLIQSPVQLQFAYTTIIYGIKILENANKLHHHLSMCRDDLAFDNGSSTNKQASPVQRVNGATKNNKKSRRRKQNSSNNTGSLNIFEKNHLSDALEDIDSDTADKMFYEAMKPWPDVKKARNSASEDLIREFDPISLSNSRELADQELYSKELSAETKAQMFDRAINKMLTTSNSSDPTQEHSDSALLRRRERDIKNQQLAERTQEMVRREKEDRLDRENKELRRSKLKKLALFGSFTALVVSSAVYLYLKNSPQI